MPAAPGRWLRHARGCRAVLGGCRSCCCRCRGARNAQRRRVLACCRMLHAGGRARGRLRFDHASASGEQHRKASPAAESERRPIARRCASAPTAAPPARATRGQGVRRSAGRAAGAASSHLVHRCDGAVALGAAAAEQHEALVRHVRAEHGASRLIHLAAAGGRAACQRRVRARNARRAAPSRRVSRPQARAARGSPRQLGGAGHADAHLRRRAAQRVR